MKKQRQRSGVRTILCMSSGLAVLLLLTGCGEEKTKSVAQNAAPSTVAAQTTSPAVSGAGTSTPDPHPWIGNKPPPGSALPPGGPKIPQK